MILKIRIYERYDRDLLALCEAENFSVPHAMKQALKYYARGMRLSIDMPKLPDHVPASQVRFRAFDIPLDEVRDREAIDFLNNNIPLGYRNGFMKHLLRGCLPTAPLSLYFDHNGSEYVEQVIENQHIGRLPLQKDIIDQVSLGDGELSATLSDFDDPLDQPSLIHEQTADQVSMNPTQKQSPSLRDVTQQAFHDAETIKKEKMKARIDAAESDSAYFKTTLSQEESDDLDSILDALMGEG